MDEGVAGEGLEESWFLGWRVGAGSIDAHAFVGLVESDFDGVGVVVIF